MGRRVRGGAGKLRGGLASWRGVFGAALILVLATAAAEPPADPARAVFKGVLVSSAQADEPRLRALRGQGTRAVLLGLAAETPAADAAAAHRIRASGLELHYWIEVGRCPALAAAHPEWMASLQGHPEWRRLFPGLAPLKPGEVMKNFPWAPICYRETFAAHLARIKALLDGLPEPTGLFLNDLQGAPSACGCGHPLCRWTADYGPVRTATPLGNDAAAAFIREVKQLVPRTTVYPVWTPECEEADKDTVCGGVGCYQGTCWREWAAQLTPVARECETVAALLPYRAFARDLPRYGAPAGWVAHAVRSFAETPQKLPGLPARRLLVVLEGWEMTPPQIQAQVAQANAAGVAGYIVAEMKIAQEWEPRAYAVP